MTYRHGKSHLVRRQRVRDPDDSDDDVQTVVSVRIITAQNTYTGKVVWVTQTQAQDNQKTLIAPMERPLPTSTKTGGDAQSTNKPTASSRKPSSTSTDGASSATKDDSTLMVATQAPTPSAGSAIAGLASATASITATATASAQASDGGMSGGAKAGLALGILVVVGALLVGILFMYRRKKKQMGGNSDNEKIDLHNAPPPPPPQVQTALAPAPTPSIRTERTMSTAPRLSLRPVTQFDPAFENRKSASNLLTAGAAVAAPVASSQQKDLPNRPTSSWERTGAANAAAENPFSDPQQSSPSSTNPFGNNAALDATQAQIPDSPPNSSPLNSAQLGVGLSTKATTAMPTAKPNLVAATTAMGNVAPDAEVFPAPPSIQAPSDGVPSSPAWTEDIPASPGPAPTGPPPVAGAVVSSRPNGAATVNNVHRIQLSFTPSMQDELELHAGQLVRMLHEYDDGWALCTRLDRSQQGVVPRTCLSKHPVKPRNGPPRQGPPPPGMRGPPIRSPMGPGGVPQPRPLSPASGRNSPHPPALSPNNGRMSPSPHSMSPVPRQMASPVQQGASRGRSNSNAPQYDPPRGAAPYAGPPRSMSPGPYGGGPQMAPPPPMEGRPRSNSASQVGNQRRGPAPGPSPMNPNVAPISGQMPARKPVPGMAI